MNGRRVALFPYLGNNKDNLETWYSSDGTISNQLDYIHIEIDIEIEQKSQITVSLTHPPKCNRAIIIEIKVTITKDYFNNLNNAYCPYD